MPGGRGAEINSYVCTKHGATAQRSGSVLHSLLHITPQQQHQTAHGVVLHNYVCVFRCLPTNQPRINTAARTVRSA